MAPTVEITIPNTTVSHTSPPHTVYHITLRLPLRSFTVPKRYSDFSTFHSTLISQTNSPPPAPLPPKTWFSKTVSNERLREDRRNGLEQYLQAINKSDDGRWRNSPAWRAFLNLPTAVASTGNGSTNTSTRLHAAITDPASTNAPITDPTLWLDYYRDMKTHLHDARLQLSRRDQETTPQKQHESSAQAKSRLVRAGTMITTLDDGLKNLGRSDKSSGSQATYTLGGGEIRRRKDLLINARKEKDGLEDLLHAMATKSRLDHAVASIQDKEALMNTGNATGDGASSGRRTPARAGRVLGKETEQTRELDNDGVLQLQRQMMQSQDQNVDELMKIIIRQRELGTQINEELEVQNDLLKLADEETDMFVYTLLLVILINLANEMSRLKSKIDVGRKRIGKIS
jgi:regulator of vacuolar morphogenesis